MNCTYADTDEAATGGYPLAPDSKATSIRAADCAARSNAAILSDGAHVPGAELRHRRLRRQALRHRVASHRSSAARSAPADSSGLHEDVRVRHPSAQHAPPKFPTPRTTSYDVTHRDRGRRPRSGRRDAARHDASPALLCSPVRDRRRRRLRRCSSARSSTSSSTACPPGARSCRRRARARTAAPRSGRTTTSRCCRGSCSAASAVTAASRSRPATRSSKLATGVVLRRRRLVVLVPDRHRCRRAPADRRGHSRARRLPLSGRDQRRARAHRPRHAPPAERDRAADLRSSAIVLLGAAGIRRRRLGALVDARDRHASRCSRSTSCWRSSTRAEWASATSSSPACSACSSATSAGGRSIVGAFAAFLLGGLFALVLVAAAAGRPQERHPVRAVDARGRLDRHLLRRRRSGAATWRSSDWPEQAHGTERRNGHGNERRRNRHRQRDAARGRGRLTPTRPRPTLRAPPRGAAARRRGQPRRGARAEHRRRGAEAALDAGRLQEQERRARHGQPAGARPRPERSEDVAGAHPRDAAVPGAGHAPRAGRRRPPRLLPGLRVGRRERARWSTACSSPPSRMRCSATSRPTQLAGLTTGRRRPHPVRAEPRAPQPAAARRARSPSSTSARTRRAS